MDAEKLTIKAQEALKQAQEMAPAPFQPGTWPRAFARGPARPSRQPDSRPVAKAGRARGRPRHGCSAGNRPQGQSPGRVPLPTCFPSPAFKKTLDAAESEAGKLRDEYISAEHLFLGLLEQGGPALKKIFQAHGLKRDTVLKGLADLRGNQRVTDPYCQQISGDREIIPTK